MQRLCKNSLFNAASKGAFAVQPMSLYTSPRGVPFSCAAIIAVCTSDTVWMKEAFRRIAPFRMRYVCSVTSALISTTRVDQAYAHM